MDFLTSIIVFFCSIGMFYFYAKRLKSTSAIGISESPEMRWRLFLRNAKAEIFSYVDMESEKSSVSLSEERELTKELVAQGCKFLEKEIRDEIESRLRTKMMEEKFYFEKAKCALREAEVALAKEKLARINVDDLVILATISKGEAMSDWKSILRIGVSSGVSVSLLGGVFKTSPEVIEEVLEASLDEVSTVMDQFLKSKIKELEKDFKDKSTHQRSILAQKLATLENNYSKIVAGEIMNDYSLVVEKMAEGVLNGD